MGKTNLRASYSKENEVVVARKPPREREGPGSIRAPSQGCRRTGRGAGGTRARMEDPLKGQHDPFTFLARWLSLFSEGKRNFQSIPPVNKLNSKTSQSHLQNVSHTYLLVSMHIHCYPQSRTPSSLSRTLHRPLH